MRSVILERAPVVQNLTNGASHGNLSDQNRVYILSAKDAIVAKAMANDFATHFRGLIAEGKGTPMGSLAYTLRERRSLFPWVVAVSARNLEELCDRWESPATKAVNSTIRPVQRLGFVFNGQGAQWYAFFLFIIHFFKRGIF